MHTWSNLCGAFFLFDNEIHSLSWTQNTNKTVLTLQLYTKMNRKIIKDIPIWCLSLAIYHSWYNVLYFAHAYCRRNPRYHLWLVLYIFYMKVVKTTCYFHLFTYSLTRQKCIYRHWLWHMLGTNLFYNVLVVYYLKLLTWQCNQSWHYL